jgi:hypothetical protein
MNQHPEDAGIEDDDAAQGKSGRVLSAAQLMNSTEHKFVGPSMHDRLIGVRRPR